MSESIYLNLGPVRFRGEARDAGSVVGEDDEAGV